MKILITTDVYAPAVNGVVTSIINLEKELSVRGHEVRVLTLSQKGGSYREGSVYYIRSLDAGKVYPGARVAFFSGHRYLNELIEWKPDVIHSQCEFTSLCYAKKIARETKAPLIHTYHTIYEDYTHYFSPNQAIGKQAAAFLTRRLLKKADLVVAPTEKVEKMLRSYGLKKEIRILPTGIQLAPFCEAAEEKEHFGRRISEKPVLITVGRVAKEKNLDEILNFLNTRKGERYHWLIVGDGPYRKTLEEKVETLGMKGQVTFTGMIPQKEVASYYQLGDVFVSASTSETQGLTYLEALAAGLPVAVRKDECLSGVVVNGYNGYQYDTEETFFEVLEKLLPEREKNRGKMWGMQYEECRSGARKTAERFSVAAFGLGAEKLYRRALEQKEDSAVFPVFEHLKWMGLSKGRTSKWKQR